MGRLVARSLHHAGGAELRRRHHLAARQACRPSLRRPCAAYAEGGRLGNAQARFRQERAEGDGRARARLLRRHHRHAGADAARHRGEDRLAARPYLPRRAQYRPDVLRPAGAALGGLPQPAEGPLPMRLVCPSRRRGRGRPRPQRRARDPEGSRQMTAPGGKRIAASATLLLLLPAMLLLAGSFLVPLVRLIALSLSAPRGRLAPYSELIGNDVYRKVFFSTFSFAAVVTAVALVLAFPLALALTRLGRRAKALLFPPVGLPLWVS